MSKNYDALLLVSFGGPEGQDDVIPFLENVLRGKPVPRERMLEVAEHYRHFGGVSPINQQNRELIECIRADFSANGIDMPVYFGNRNWHPMLPDTLRQMKEDGVKCALAFFTSIYSCYSGCRQYRENIMAAQEEVGEGAPEVHKLRMSFNHPNYVEASASRVKDAVEQIDEAAREDTLVLFTAHSIPMSMAENSDYEKQLKESCRVIMQQVGSQPWELVYQSRSGPPSQPWLEPDVCDHIQSLSDSGSKPQNIVIMPVGFVSDHMEVMFDLDTEAAELCEELGINMVRSKTVGTHPAFVSMVRELIVERTSDAPKLAVGDLPAWHDVCPKDCCKYEPRRPAARPG
ncbi:MAG: ferrochelatase [Planctomycetota bacterium]